MGIQGITGDYNGLQRIIGGYKGCQFCGFLKPMFFCSERLVSYIKRRKSFFPDLFSRSMTWEYTGLQWVTGGYKGLQGVTRGYRGLQGVTRYDRG